MSDGIKGLISDINEAGVKPVADEVGKAMEQAAQSVIQGAGSNQTKVANSPAGQNPQKQAEDQAGLIEARRKIAFWKNLADEQAKLRAQQKAKEEERLKAEEKKKEIKQFARIKKQESLNTAVRNAQTKTEIKKGVGG
ncbi:MAG: hypothetical protein HYW45_03130 [Candidatus Daviesbacteria bacterium]|nr:MAG: hypothetical protein HYW45_03130 [Candidatus Daviesbacteria bacterium]